MVDKNPSPATPNYDKLTTEQKAAVDWQISQTLKRAKYNN